MCAWEKGGTRSIGLLVYLNFNSLSFVLVSTKEIKYGLFFLPTYLPLEPLIEYTFEFESELLNYSIIYTSIIIH